MTAESIDCYRGELARLMYAMKADEFHEHSDAMSYLLAALNAMDRMRREAAKTEIVKV